MCLKNMLECFKINFQPVACHAGSAVKKNPSKQCKKKKSVKEMILLPLEAYNATKIDFLPHKRIHKKGTLSIISP